MFDRDPKSFRRLVRNRRRDILKGSSLSLSLRPPLLSLLVRSVWFWVGCGCALTAFLVWLNMRVQYLDSLSSGRAYSILADLMKIPLALVGAIIPLILLLVELTVRRADTAFLRTYFKRQGASATLYFAVMVLAVGIGITVGVKLVESPDTYFVHYGVLIFCELVFCLFIVVVIFIRRSVQTLRPDTLFHLIREELKGEMGRDLDKEISYRLNSNLFREQCQKRQLVLIPRANPHRFYPIKSTRFGTVTDVDLHRVKKGAEMLEQQISPPSSDQPYRAIITVTPGSQLSSDDNILALVSPTEPQLSQVAQTFIAAFKVAPDRDVAAEKGRTFREVLEEFKATVYQFVQTNHERRFEQALECYVDLLHSTMETLTTLGIQLTPDQLEQPFSEWRSIFLLSRDLEDIIAIACKSPNRNFIGVTAHHLQEILGDAVRFGDFMVFKHISSLLPAVYYHARLHGNTVGLDRCHSTLLHVVDYVLLPRVRKAGLELKKVEAIRQFLLLILGQLSQVTKYAYDLQDVESYTKVIQQMEEILARYHPCIETERQGWEIERKLTTQKIAGEEKEILERQLRAGKLLGRLPQDKDHFLDDLLLSAGGLIASKYRQGQLDPETCRKFLEPSLSRFHSIDRLVKTFERASLELHIAGRSHWKDVPDTRRVYSEDRLSNDICFYCLAGVSVQGTKTDPLSVPPSASIKNSLSRIRETCETMKKEKGMWERVVGGLSDAVIERFIEVNTESASEYERQVEDDVIRAPLSENKIASFRDEVISTYLEETTVRPLLEDRRLVVEATPLEEKVPDEEFLGIVNLQPKEIFIEQDRVAYLGGLGAGYGRGLAEGEDEKIVRDLLQAAGSVRPVLKDTRVGSRVAQVLNSLRDSGYRPSLIAVPHAVRFEETLLADSKFIPRWQVTTGSAKRNIVGLYDDVPVVSSSDEDLADSVLAVDLERGCRLEQQEEVSVSVQILSKEDRERIREKRPTVSDRQLDQQVKVTVRERFRVKIANPGAIVKTTAKSKKR